MMWYKTEQGATWPYTSDDDVSPVPEDWVWKRLRAYRNHLLTITDYRMVLDAPWEIEPWVLYRQALRDITNTDNPRTVTWPEMPEERPA